MPTLTLDFGGYLQLRMATDPDPTDDPRGLSGYTFALPGEPDFDGLLHLQPDEPGVFERAFGPPPDASGPRVGVTVRRASLIGNAGELDVSSLVGARLAFPGARLVERNGLVVRNDFFAIDPLRVVLRAAHGPEVLLDRRDLLDPARPHLRIVDAGSAELMRRQPAGWVSDSSEVATATGLPQPITEMTYVDNRRARQRALIALREQTTDPIAQSGLDTRIEELNTVRRFWELSVSPRPVDRRAYTLGLQAQGWSLSLNGPIVADGLGCDPDGDWALTFWLGGWDADALCAYIQGTLTLPIEG